MDAQTPTSIMTMCANDSFDDLANFFTILGGNVVGRKPQSMTAMIRHPDGKEVFMEVSHDHRSIEVIRQSGDRVLFDLIYKMLVAYDFGRGSLPFTYNGQLCPKVTIKPALPEMLVPFLRLDLGGQKRKHT